MSEKGFSTLLGLCFLLPMLFLASVFFSVFSNEQRIEMMDFDGAKAQYTAESAIEKALKILYSDLSAYDKMRREAQGQTMTYKKEIFSENSQIEGYDVSSIVYLRFFNYDDSYFTLTAVSKFNNASKRVTVYIREKNHILSIIRWDYHE